MNQKTYNNIIDDLEDIKSYLGLVTCTRMAMDSENYCNDLITKRMVDTLYIAENFIEDKLDLIETILETVRSETDKD